MGIDLDNELALRALDPHDMLGWVERFPEQFADAWARADALSLPDTYRNKQHIVILGMGGSAIGGDLLAALMAPTASVPVSVIRGYELPAWVNEDTLVIASSYSGNTEETLTTFHEALERKAAVIALTTNGQLEREALDNHLPVIIFPGGGQPRAALGYSLILLLGIVETLGYFSLPPEARAEAAQIIDELNAACAPGIPKSENPAKQYAQMVYQRIPFVLGAGHLQPVARRWKTQFNENSKTWAAYDEMPEFNHNLIVGTKAPPDLAQHVLVISLESTLDHPRVKARWDIVADIFQKARLPHVRVQAPGHHPFAQMMGTIYLGDYVTVYLAFLNGQDPSAIENINALKSALAQLT